MKNQAECLREGNVMSLMVHKKIFFPLSRKSKLLHLLLFPTYLNSAVMLHMSLYVGVLFSSDFSPLFFLTFSLSVPKIKKKKGQLYGRSSTYIWSIYLNWLITFVHSNTDSMIACN